MFDRLNTQKLNHLERSYLMMYSKIFIICVIFQMTLQWRMPIRVKYPYFRTISYSFPRSALGVTTKTQLYLVPFVTNTIQESLKQDGSNIDVDHDVEIQTLRNNTEAEILDEAKSNENVESSETSYDDSPANDIVSEDVMNTDFEESSEDVEDWTK